MKCKAILALLLVFCVFPTVAAQTKPAAPSQPQKTSDDDVVRITTNLVQVDAVVTKDGKAVTNLTAEDFEIYEDGKKQTITSFAFISNVPATTIAEPPAKEKPTEVGPTPRLNRDNPRRTVALVVDDLGLSFESMVHVRSQVKKFIAEELQPTDLVAVMRTSGELGALQQFTNDKRLLNRAVDRLRWNICSRVGVNVIPRYDPDMARLEDSWFNCGAGSYYHTLKSLQFILDAMGQLPGRKSMVILSDSLPAENQEVKFENEASNTLPNTTSFTWALQRIAEKAIRASVVIYSVDTQGLQYIGLTAADNPRMSNSATVNETRDLVIRRSKLLWGRREGGDLIARQTGGFQVRSKNSFDLPRILQDQSGYYLLGYRPTSETFNRRFHHIKAKVKGSGLTLRTRFGFLGVSEEELVSDPMQRFSPTSTNLALMSPFGAQDIEVNLVSFFTNDRAKGSLIRSFVYIDPKALTFETVEGMRKASFELHGVIFGDNGTVVETHKGGATLTLNDRDYELAIRNGMATTVDMTVKRPGSYQVRIATRDKISSKIGSAGQFVEVPDLNKKRLAVSGIVLADKAGSSGFDVVKISDLPGARSFDLNTDLHFAFLTYNATSTSNLVMQAKLFRDGKAVYSGQEMPINVGNQADPSRLLVNGSLRLRPDLELGSYYLQVVITDKSAKSKMAPVVQWIDFDVVR